MSRPYYTPENFQCRKSIGHLTRRLHNLLLPRAEARFAEAELTFSHWVALMAVKDGIRTCADIARYMNHDSGATTRLIDQLEARGLVERHRDTADRRVVNLKLTPEGQAVAHALTPRIVDYWNEVLADFAPAEIATLIDLLTRLVERVEQSHIQPADKRAAP